MRFYTPLAINRKLSLFIVLRKVKSISFWEIKFKTVHKKNLGFLSFLNESEVAVVSGLDLG